MYLKSIATGLLLAGSALASAMPGQSVVRSASEHHPRKIAPKIFIVSMFEPEATVWWGIPDFDLLAHNITVPGASPIYPDVYCTADYSICQLITGEGEINAAITVSSVAFSPLFDLTHTYFLIAGIAGISPKAATIGGVTFARYAVQVALQYEIDLRDLPANATSPYFPQGAKKPGEYPGAIYGTEVFEVNADLRSIAASFARTADLADSDTAKRYRSNYATADGIYAAGTQAPSVVECDVSTTDVFFSGSTLDEIFEDTLTVWTNGTGSYCSTAQEDNATLEALLRAAKHRRVDFARIIVMRTGSNFDRPYPGQSALDNLIYADQGGFGPSVQNLYNAGIKVVDGILAGWNTTFAVGVKASNYLGDEFGTLGGKPDFGPGRAIALKEGSALKRRGIHKGGRRW
ncbi:purine-nucleoside phosphorylase [Aspergillus clavatus NRRL 1]|uniref:Purine nucleoside permease, putative n=1 Tax=Aspergillus clavatus (strain ATCC 1007 / CBS 513.65 / DSM 816 / NCTC 3887 / NRRL 1 / QM 1276 / 107) TaxID=344612 RepID=A1CFS3_ASPCL|nr:purine nucleoside permease, putative [Aspergillus clavatus NRRL 1]EAW11722.1 purine nucleoside permease, putative [Aspergillus clavatus NRRL 1]